MFRSLSTKIAAVISVLAIIAMGVVGIAYTYKFVSLYNTLKERPFESSLLSMQTHLQQWLLAGTPLLDIPTVNQNLFQQLEDNPNIVSLDVVDNNGVVVFSADKSFIGDESIESAFDAVLGSAEDDEANFDASDKLLPGEDDKIILPTLVKGKVNENGYAKITLINDLNDDVGRIIMVYSFESSRDVLQSLLTALILMLIVFSPIVCIIVFFLTRQVLKHADFESWLVESKTSGESANFFTEAKDAEDSIKNAHDDLKKSIL